VGKSCRHYRSGLPDLDQREAPEQRIEAVRPVTERI